MVGVAKVGTVRFTYNGLNRSRGRALRRADGRASNGWNDGSVLSDDEGQKHVPKPMSGQHDDRPFYHRRRWERSERSETNLHCGQFRMPSHDHEWCIRRVRNNSVGRCHVEQFVRPMRYKGCRQANNAQVEICALFTTRNSLKLQVRRKVFSPIRKVRAISQKLCSQSGSIAVKFL